MIDPIRDPHMSLERRWKHAVFLGARVVIVPLLRLTLRMRIYGLKNVPRRGGALVICNHLDWFDPVLLLAASPRPILFMAKAEFLGYRVLRWFAFQAGAFPVRRGQPDRAALRHAQSRLAVGMLVGMFPEGTRSSTGGLKDPFPGASLIAVRSNAPVIPCALIGTEDLPLSGINDERQKRYPRISAIFGEPFMLRLVRDDGSKFSLDELTDAMMIEIARLLPEQYRGIYADRAGVSHPAVSRDAITFTGPQATSDRPGRGRADRP
jgi:1-acyl-sn-glycerol-3-phosphate acyltransferase